MKGRMKKAASKKTGAAGASKLTKSNYRRVTDGIEVRRVTFDLPEQLLHRMTVYAAQRRTTKVTILRELLEKHVPTLEALVPPTPATRTPATKPAA